jgi:hypothetical protein
VVLGGEPGAGKDTLLEPVKSAVGPWNFLEASPHHLLSQFNGFLRSVILRVSEARDLGDFDRFAFYEHMKVYTAAPPDVLRINEKHLREYYIPNVTGVIILTNHKADGIYLPPNDRRHFVAWTDTKISDFADTYFMKLYAWYANGGNEFVANYLATLDLSHFNPKAPPPKTNAFWEIVNASRSPEDAEMADALENLQNPEVVTVNAVKCTASASFGLWLADSKNARKIPHRFESCGYNRVHNPDAEDGRWKIGKRREVVYGRRELSQQERLAAANNLTRQPEPF